jgi:hypothetical protein
LKTALDPFTERLNLQNDVLGRARNSYLEKEAERKHFEAVLIRQAEGKSMAERTVNAQATEVWMRFMKDLARLESVYEFQKLKYEILDKEWQAHYLTHKLDGRTIGRQGT